MTWKAWRKAMDNNTIKVTEWACLVLNFILAVDYFFFKYDLRLSRFWLSFGLTILFIIKIIVRKYDKKEPLMFNGEDLSTELD